MSIIIAEAEEVSTSFYLLSQNIKHFIGRLWNVCEIHRSLRVNKMDQRHFDFGENLLKSFMFHQNKVLNDTIYNSFPGVRSFFDNYTLEPQSMRKASVEV